jgi:hypothetical protein
MAIVWNRAVACGPPGSRGRKCQRDSTSENEDYPTLHEAKILAPTPGSGA